MGSSKKGGDQEVFDFLMSIDYGMCYGPVDSYNQVWVKDKPIWCGTADERTDIVVNQPELFGGDTGEGGVVGTVEVYMGDEDQLCSTQLAGRVGLTPTTMPGYKGLSHLFFRGSLGSEEPVLNFESGGLFATLAEFLIGGTYGSNAARGFRWATNNPYLPEMKASITRMPKLLSSANQFIYPPIIDENGNLADDPDGAVQVIPDLIAPPSYTNSIPVYTAYDFYIIADQAQAPYTRLNFDNVSDDELVAAAAAGWVPQIRINVDYALLDDVSAVVPSCNHRMRIIEYDGLGVEVRRTDRQALASEQFTVQEDITLLSTTREVAVVITSFPLGGETISATNGPRTVQLFFTEELLDSFTFNAPYTDLLGQNSFEATAEVYDLIALGFTQQAIDDGLVTVRATSFFAAQETGLGGGSGEAFNGSTKITGFAEDPRVTGDWVDTGHYLYDADTNPGTGTFSNFDVSSPDPIGWVVANSGVLRMRPGTRYIAIYSFVVRLSPVLSYWTMRDSKITFTGPAKITGTVHCSVDKNLGVLPDANPSQMIYECMVNNDWGKGEDPAMMNTQTFIDAATLFEQEYFGLSMGFYKQDKIEKFVQEILDHVQAFLFQDPATGLWEIKPLRDDYDIETAMTVNESNATLRNPKRLAWGETINEIVVSYTDPLTEQEATVSSHNLGNIAMQGGIASETRNYYGIRNPIIAKIVADRDVAAAGYPILTCQAVVDRTFWRIRPGDVVKLSWDDEGLTNAVMRVMGVDYGSPTNREIVLDLSEDIFALEQTSYSGGQTSELTTDRIEATPLDPEIVVTAPAPLMIRNGLPIEEIDAAEPAVAGLLMVDQTPRPLAVQVHTQVTKANGDSVIEEIGNIPVARSILTEAELPVEITSRIDAALVSAVMQGNEDVGDLLMLGLSEAESELIMLDEFIEADNEWVVLRGIWDTIPALWPVGTRLWDFPEGTVRADPGERTSGETRTYRFLPKTSFNRLPYADAADVTVTFTDRPFAPFRPANCQLDGNGFGKADYLGADPMPTEIVATWVNRNRGTEDAVANSWDDINLTPEVGQTVTLEIYDNTDTFSHEITGLTGTSYNIPIASFAPVENGSVRFVSVRDGIKSLWGIKIEFDIRSGGYGLAYGQVYGGSA